MSCPLTWALLLAAIAIMPAACRVDSAGMPGQAVVPSTGIDPDSPALPPAPAKPDGTAEAVTDAAVAGDGADPQAGAVPPWTAVDATVAIDGGAAADVGPSLVPPDAAVAPPVDSAPPSSPPMPSPRCDGARGRAAVARRIGPGPTSDDITFDPEGRLVSFDGRGLVRVHADGGWQIIERNLIGQRGGALRAMPTGELVIGDFERDSVFVRGLDGAIRPAAQAVAGPMKMVRGPKGTVYVSGHRGVVTRVDVATGATTRVAETSLELGGLTFALDHKTLYVAATDTDTLYALEVGADGRLGAPRVVRANLVDVSALTTDECGNIYVVAEGDGRVRRLRPDQPADLEVVAEVPARFLWSLAFGSGRHGWSAEALYVLEAGGGALYELPIGLGAQPPPSD